MTFFFDNCIPRAIAEALQTVKFDVVHLQDLWPDAEYPDGVPDEVWIPEVGARGFVVVSGDMALTTRPAQVIAFQRAGLIVYVFYPGFVNIRIPEQARWLFQHWHKIEEHAARHAATGHAYVVRSNGDIRERNLREVRHKNIEG